MTATQQQEKTEQTSWSSLVRNGGYLTPVQRQAFENAIALVNERLQTTLDKPGNRVNGQFSLNNYIDSLESDFKRDAGADELRGDASLTAFWIVRLLADRLLEAAGARPVVH
ncbi:HrpW-specific chaperone [Pseudomonas cichorii]|uniref:HrpW-specific chaperone n=1 Tax=Pseudomonas cichorii TaxID=36746 RepID=A0A3M4LFG2_PSECI|nr:HrpW-specific chaperone [Pseudomonas cichorii]RMQ40243.1 HrpW-specific chaperone [Pseudomonas cichorii]